MIFDIITSIMLLLAGHEDIKKKQVSNIYFYLMIIISIIKKQNIDIYLIIYIIFLIIIKNIFDKNIGYGDIKILIGIGLVSGYEVSIISFILASSLSIIYMLLRKKKTVAFIPFISLSYICLINIKY
ncbi:MAG: prepilin peptidase [Lachnospiraceae bacterium]|nr:prepilin peptidase [Lachnospiraceae bacterium]